MWGISSAWRRGMVAMKAAACRDKGFGRGWVGVKWAMVSPSPSGKLMGAWNGKFSVPNCLCQTWTHWEQACAFFWSRREAGKTCIRIDNVVNIFLEPVLNVKSLVRMEFVLCWINQSEPWIRTTQTGGAFKRSGFWRAMSSNKRTSW